MTAETKIEWADSTFNPWSGCTKISPACDHCYAEALSKRAPKTIGQWGAGAPRRRTSPAYWKQPLQWNARADVFRECASCGWRGDLALRDEPIAFACPTCDVTDWKPARRRVFCASLADWLDNEAPIEWLVDLLDLIRRTPNLDWLLLSKRIGNWRNRVIDAGTHAASIPNLYLSAWLRKWFAGIEVPSNIWLGATICNQAEADRDIPKLLATPAAKRFLSIEPMLGPIDLRVAFTGHCPTHDFPGGFCLQRNHAGVQHLDWIICGGESGPHARPMHPQWARSLRDQCSAAGVPFLFKQWGEWCPRGPAELGYPPVDGVPRLRMTDTGENGSDLGAGGDNHVWMNRAGKHAAGRLLDGVEHNGVPA